MSASANAVNAGAAPSAREIQEWMLARIAQELRVEPTSLDPRAPFVRYGLDSVAAVAITADLSGWLAREIDPALLWDYPNIEALSAHLAEGLG